MATDTEWTAFNPGFEHGEVDMRESNIEGVFSAEKIKRLPADQLDGAEVRTSNLGGAIGEESFDWRKADTGGADVRMANCSGQLGSESFDWGKVDLQGADVRRANLKGSTIEEKTFEGLDLAGADVRAPNVPGQIGDKAFNKLLAANQTPLTPAQSSWRLATFATPLFIFGLVKPVMSAVPDTKG